jgi:hypothetical protein
MKTKLKTTETISKLIIHIDHNWSAFEFATLFDSINRLYEFHKLLDGTINVYAAQGKELEWNEKMNSLPTFVNIKQNFLKESLRIFNSNNNPSDYDIFNSHYLHIGLYPLQVKKLKFGSKGSVDFAGLGKIFETIKDLIIHYFPNKDKKIDMILKLKEIEERDQKIMQLKIENLKKMGISQKEIMTVIGMESFHVNNILTLKDKGILIDIEVNHINE